MEVKLTSKELIQPSSPTPQHLKTFKLSRLDQQVHAPYSPITLFYHPDCSSPPGKPLRARLDHLKLSLSRILTLYYPLAGKIRDDFFVDCDDGGAYFVETTVNVSLSQSLDKPDLMELQRFLPCDEETPRAANIQANVFQCSGIAIGICISHKLLDGAGMSGFLKEWAAEARGGSREAVPSLLAAGDLFPTDDDLWLRDSTLALWGSLSKMGNFVTKRFVFDGTAIKALKDRGTGPNVKSPTRVEAVSGFLWKCSMAAFKRKNNGLKRPSFSIHLVNFRKRMDTALSELSLGNLIWMTPTKLKSLDYDQPEMLPSLVAELRETISKIDQEFVSRLRWDKDFISGYIQEITDRMDPKEAVDSLAFTSWCRFGYYEVDFGWGKPVWVSSVGLNQSSNLFNLIVLTDTRSGSGIEAWVTLDEQDMAQLEADPDIRSFTFLDPDPLMVY